MSDEYDAAVSASLTPSFAGAARASYMGSMDTNPDMYAEAQRVARRTGLPVDTVMAVPQEAKRQDVMGSINFDTLAKVNPSAAKFLADSENAKVAHDDVPALLSIENAVGNVTKYLMGADPNANLGRDVEAAGYQAGRMVAGVGRAVFDTLALPEEVINTMTGAGTGPLRRYADVLGKSAEGFGKLAQESGSQWAPNSLMAQIFGGGVSSGVSSGLTNLGTAAAASYLLGPEVGIPATLAVMALGQGGDSYQKAREAGKGTVQSLAYGAEDATAEYVTEKYLGMAGFLERAVKGAGVKKLMAYELSKEVPGEMAATLWQNFNEWTNINPNKTVVDFLKEQPVALAQTVMATLVGGTIQTGAFKATDKLMGRLADTYQEAERVNALADRLVDMQTAVQASKLLERSPETLNAYLQDMVAEGVPNIYLDGAALIKAGVDLNALAQAMPSLATQGEALQRGGDLVVPTSELLTGSIGTGYEQALIDHARTSEHAMSRVEAQAFMDDKGEQIKADMDRAAQAYEQDSAFKTNRDELKDQLLGQLNAVAAGTPKANELHANMVANFFAVMAARQGMTPGELYAKFPLRVAKGGQSAQGFTQQSFGPVFDGYTNNPQGAIERLMAEKHGEVSDAFMHPELGPIAFVYGNEHFGLRHIAERRGTEFIQHIPDILAAGRVVRDKGGLPRAYVVDSHDPAHVAVVRLDWDGHQKTWLVTAFPDAVGKFEGVSADAGSIPRGDTSVATDNPGHADADNITEAVQTYKQALMQDQRDLMVTHNLTADNLLHAAKLGGFDDLYFQQSRGTFSPDQMLITLGQSADLSTFIHESGHFFLEAMASMAADIEARLTTGDLVSEGERGILADFNTALKWMGVTATPELSAVDAWHSMTLDEKREFHETWARGFEAYAFEGKAPEMGMAKMFQTFRSWMVNIYKAIKNLDVKLDDEVRGVFDRMLATSEQIAETEAARSMGALFETAEQAGMTVEEFKAYHELATQATMDAAEALQAKTLKDMQWLSRAKSRVLKQLQAQHKEVRAQTRRDVTREVMSQPVYLAWQFLTGKVSEKSEAQVAHEQALADWKKERADFEEQTKQALKDKLLADNPDVKGIAKGQLIAKSKRQMGIDTEQAMLGWDREHARPVPPEKPTAGFDGGEQIFGKLSLDHLMVMVRPVDLATLPKAPKTGTGPVNPETDSILQAIAKLGGIDRESAGKHLGVHSDDFSAKSGVSGKPVFRKEGGKSADTIGEALAELGYLPKDEHGKYDIADLEAAISEELGGTPQYSTSYDYSRERVAEQADEAMSLALPIEVVNTLKSRKMTAKDGLHPDMVAESFGFSSGDELVRALAAAVPPKEAIEAGTDKRMMAEHADLANPKALERAADEAVHNEARARFVATELSTLEAANNVKAPNAKGRNTVDVIAKAAKEYAQGIIARLKVRDINPSQYVAAEARAAKAAMKSTGDLAKQAEHKRNQLINLQAAKAAYAALDEVDKVVRYLKKFDRAGVRANLPAEYLAQIDALLDKYDLRKQSGVAIDKAVALRTWVQGRLNAGVIPVISESLLTPQERAAYSAQINSRDENGELTYADDEERIKLLADAIERSAKRSYKDMTLEELRGLNDTIAQMEHLGRLKDKLLTAKDGRIWTEKRDMMIAELVGNAKHSGKNDRSSNTWLGKRLQDIKQFGASHIKAATWMLIFDGGKEGGIWWETVQRTANERATFETARRAQATEVLTKVLGPIIAKVPKTDLMGSGKSFPMLGKGVSLNWQERFSFLLNYGNESNLQRLMDGGIANGPRSLTMAQVHAVLSTATAAEWKAAQAIWDHFESYRPEIGAKEMRVSGVEPDWIQPRAFSIRTADGQQLTLRGGYYPVKFDNRVNLSAAQHADSQDAKNAMKAAYSAATTQRGFTKTRVEEVHGRPLMLGLQGLYSGINDVIHDLAWHEWIIDMNRIMRSQSIDEAIREHYGPEVVKELTKWRDDIVAGSKRLDHQLEAASGWIRRSVSVAALSYNVMSAIMQPLGITQSISRVGAGWVGKGVAQYVARPIESTAMVKEKSGFMAARTRTMFRDLNELRNKVAGQTTAGELMGRYGFFLTAHAQMMVDVPTWIGAYEKGIAGGHDEATAIALADQAVKDSQGGGEEVDQSGITRGGPMVKLFTAFYEFMNTQANVLYLAHATTDTKAKEFVHFALVGVVPVLMSALLRDALTPGDSGDWDDPEHIMKKVLSELGSNLFGMVAFGREFAGAFKFLVGDGKGISYSGPTGLRFIGDVEKLAKQIKQGELDDAFRKAFVNVLGDLTGIPAVQINRTVTGTEALSQGKTDNPAAVVFGFQEKH
jgi:hypothetical protein